MQTLASLSDVARETLADQIRRIDQLVPWVQEAIQASLAERDGNAAANLRERACKVHAEYNVVTKSYLAFLEGQIGLSPRGLAWTQILNERLRALRPHVGERLLSVSVNSPRGYCILEFLASDCSLVRWEYAPKE